MTPSQKMIILAVDDDEKNLKSLRRIFNDYEDYSLNLCSSGEEALERLTQLKPDLVLLDILMRSAEVRLLRVFFRTIAAPITKSRRRSTP